MFKHSKRTVTLLPAVLAVGLLCTGLAFAPKGKKGGGGGGGGGGTAPYTLGRVDIHKNVVTSAAKWTKPR